MRKRWTIFILSLLILNAFGNALTIKAGTGATIWAASFDNLANLLHVSVGTAINIISISLYLISKLIGRDFSIRQALSCVVASLSFGYATNFWLWIIGIVAPNFSPENVTPLNYIASLIGIAFTAIFIVICIKVDVCYLAIDDYLKNLRINVFNENIFRASLASAFTGFLIAVVSGLLATGKISGIVNLNFITVIFIFLFSPEINFFFKHINFKLEPKPEGSIPTGH